MRPQPARHGRVTTSLQGANRGPGCRRTRAQHVRQDSLRGVEGRREHHAHQVVPLVLWEFVHGRHVLDARVVHQDVDAAEALSALAHHVANLSCA